MLYNSLDHHSYNSLVQLSCQRTALVSTYNSLVNVQVYCGQQSCTSRRQRLVQLVVSPSQKTCPPAPLLTWADHNLYSPCPKSYRCCTTLLTTTGTAQVKRNQVVVNRVVPVHKSWLGSGGRLRRLVTTTCTTLLTTTCVWTTTHRDKSFDMGCTSRGCRGCTTLLTTTCVWWLYNSLESWTCTAQVKRLVRPPLCIL